MRASCGVCEGRRASLGERTPLWPRGWHAERTRSTRLVRRNKSEGQWRRLRVLSQRGGGMAAKGSEVINKSGGCWGDDGAMLFSRLRSFLVLTSTNAPSKQAGNPAFWPFFGTRRRHHRPPLRGGRLRYRAPRRAQHGRGDQDDHVDVGFGQDLGVDRRLRS